MWRLFIAAPIPESIRSLLDAQLEPYRRRHPTARWLARETWHLTLLFLGSVAALRVPELVRLVDETAHALSPFDVRVDRGGGRTRHGDGVAWLRVATGATLVIAAADRLAAACPPDITLGPPPKRTPSAHLTVARRADEALVADLGDARRGPLQATWTASGLALYRSHLSASGALYEVIHGAALTRSR